MAAKRQFFNADDHGNIIVSQEVETTYVSYEDTSFVTGDSPVSIDILTDLGRASKSGFVKNDGNGDMQISFNEGDNITLKTGDPAFSFDGIEVSTITITWVANTSYRIVAK